MNTEQTELQKAIKVLQNALNEGKDPDSYYFGWQANIAMAYVDEFNKQWKEREKFTKWLMLEKGDVEIANQAAKNFLELLLKQ